MASSYSRDRTRALTPRMLEVLAGAADGETVPATAARLAVSSQTVKTVRTAARERLGEPTTLGAAARARLAGWL